MKTLLCILLAALGFTAQAQMNYANVSINTITATLPGTLINDDGSLTFGPSSNTLWTVGWRTVNFVQAPTNGWAVDTYTISNTTNGYASLLIGTQHNIRVAADAAMTNSYLWTSTFVTNAQKFRAILRASGTTETNAVVTVDTMNAYISTVMSTNALSVLTNLSSFIFMANEAPQLLILGNSDTTAHFPWRLIP
jgi:hypothetical protein